MAEPAIIGVQRAEARLPLPFAIAAFSFLVALAFAPNLLRDPDTLWHVVTGNWILAHGSVPHVDFYSYTMTGKPWVAHEWLAEVLLAGAYDLLGWHGLALLGALAVAAAMGILSRALLRSLDPIHVVIAVMSAWILLTYHILARPHLLALPLLVLWISTVVAARDAGKAPALPWALLMVPWANMHGSFLFGLGFAGMLALEAFARAEDSTERWRAVWGWGRFIGLASLLPLIGPNGAEVYLLPLRLLGMTYTLSILAEWNAPDFNLVAPLEFWLLLAVLVGFVTRFRLPWSRALMVLFLLHLALKHERHGELLGFGAALLVASPLGAYLREQRLASGLPLPEAGTGLRLRRPVLAFGGLAFIALVALAYMQPLAPPPYRMPAAALQAVRDRHVTGNVLNADSFGGYLIWEGIPTFVDGRADMFGDAFIEREHKAMVLASGELPALLEEYAVTWTLFQPNARAVVLLDHLPGWQRLYTGEFAVVHVRSAALPPR
ncbi:MAG TPA: hypothetical protein VK433_07905 [Stellaceae bacterium]|nr:hypothetical protein [Stellaceae bacterium]